MHYCVGTGAAGWNIFFCHSSSYCRRALVALHAYSHAVGPVFTSELMYNGQLSGQVLPDSLSYYLVS